MLHIVGRVLGNIRRPGLGRMIFRIAATSARLTLDVDNLRTMNFWLRRCRFVEGTFENRQEMAIEDNSKVSLREAVFPTSLADRDGGALMMLLVKVR